MNYWIHHTRASLVRLLKRVDIYVANDQEARSLTQESNLLKAAKALHALGPGMILIKKGEHGVMLYSKEFIFSLPAYPVDKVIDPTGAGDTFAGGFMGYLTSVRRITRATLKKAAAYGTVAASFNVEAFGMERTSRLTKTVLEKRLAQFKDIVTF
jgi:sugar/nucleoside kinase (ribokinase family)